MILRIHIERLILDGLPIARGQESAVRAAVEAELARLFSEGALPPGLMEGGSRPSASGGALQMTRKDPPARIGQQIARGISGGIRP